MLSKSITCNKVLTRELLIISKISPHIEMYKKTILKHQTAQNIDITESVIIKFSVVPT